MKTKLSVRLPSHVKPERYEIMLKTDFEGFKFSGEETIFLILEKPVSEIILHSVDLDIESAQAVLNAKPVQAEISYNQKEETATFKFPKTLPKGKIELKLLFNGILSDSLRGFYKSRYELNGDEKYLATTQFESTDARRAFPSIDEPSVKAIFDISLMIPEGIKAISNTIDTEILEHESGYQIVKFAPTPKMSTYLLAFIVGDFEWIEGKTKERTLVRIFTTPGKKKQAEFALDVTKKTLSFYNKYFGIPYPLPVLDVIAIPDFAAGAMENWGAITYRETAILVDPENSSLANKQWVAIVIAHELAHQWFGNLVTMEWWTHLWLNEGFASFIEYLAVDELFPEWDIWTQFVYLDMGAALKLDGLENTHPIEVDVHHPSEITEIFDKVSYSKGASIIRMLYNYLGEKDFRDGLRFYLKKHAYSNAKTEDLWAAFEHISKKPVANIMKNWTSKPGYPILTVTEKPKSLQISQSRFFSSILSKKESKDKTVWHVPFSVSTQGKTKTYLLDSKKMEIEKPGKGEWIKLNYGETAFSRVDYPVKFLELLNSPIQRKTLEASDRLGIIRDAFDLSESDQLPTNQAMELALNYKEETDYSTWAELTSHLSEISNLLADEPFYENFNSYGRAVYGTVSKDLGWKKKQGEKHTDTLLRSLALGNYGGYGDGQTIEEAGKLFASHINGQKLEADLRGVVYKLVAENGLEIDYQTLRKLYKDEQMQEEKNRLARALTLFKQPELLQKTLDFALSDEVRAQDAVFVIAGVFGNPYGKNVALNFVFKNWKELQKRYGGGHFLLARLIQGMSVFNSFEKANEIKTFFKKNPTPEAKRTIDQVLEQIYSNTLWLKRDKKGIEKFLRHFT